MRNFLAIFLILSGINLSAITIKSINYEGMVHISQPVALRMLSFEVNDNIDDEILDEAIKKYFKQGYFTDVWAEYDDGNLTFHFKEKAIISKIELKGWKDNDKDILDSVVQIKKGSLYDKKKLLAAKKRIIEAISQEGSIDSVVEIEEEHLDNGSIKVTFIANEGEEIIIENLEYSGVENLDSGLFNEVIANKEHQFMGWFWGRNSGDMKLTDLAYDPLRIRDTYMQYGYLDAKVDEPFVRVNFDDYTAQMSYQIEEGEAYSISKISLQQSDKVISDEKIREVIDLEIGENFNINTFRSDAQKIKTIMADLSYAFVQVTPDLRKNKKDHTVEVVFKIVPGEKVTIRNVVISGNTRTLDRIIRRELYLGPGDKYSLTDLKDSRNSIGRLGFFEGNTIEERRVDNSTMDLVVKVKEAPTGNIQIGGGYGSYGGLLVTLAVNDRNIWGSGINMGVQVERSQKTKNYSFNISNPRLNDSDFSGNFSVYMSDIEYNDYDVSTLGTGVGTGHRFSRNITGFVGYNYSKNDYDLHDLLDVGEDNETVNYYFESYAKSAMTISASFDNTDDYYLPREGATFRQSFEKSGLGGEADFFKTRTNFGKYNGLEDYVGFDAIFRYKARYYFAADTGYLPVAERFYMGGLGSVRGYESYSISPSVNEKDGRKRLIGGAQTFSNNVELSLPLVPKAKMRLVSFLDWGFIGDDSLSEFSRGGYGLGLEWFSPVGPVQIMFARPLNNEKDDRTSKFDFTMGQRF
ncbi:MAG: outer membrane protein assembly factor BamA [Sulfurimonas sp.]|nr:outer membrane protein assembly factor BamA [Sulfurimonas sp.]